MMHEESLTKQVMQNTSDIAAVRESTKSAHKRLDENDRMTESIHELTKSVVTIAAEIKALTAKLDQSVERIEAGQRAQGERIGKLETAFITLAHDEKTIEDHEKRIDAMEKEPAQKWKDLVKQVIALAVAAIVGGLFAGIIGG